jgi:hypothetical protein
MKVALARSAAGARRLVLRIDRLVLEMYVRDPHAMGVSLQAELARLLAEPTTVREIVARSRVESLRGDLAAPAADASTAGKHIARSVARALAPGRIEGRTQRISAPNSREAR